MRIDNPSKTDLKKWINNIDSLIDKQFSCTKYIDFGSCTIRLICYSKKFLPLIEKQLTYVLKDSSTDYSATIVVWNELEAKTLAEKIDEKFNPKKNLRMRVEMLASKQKYVNLQVYDESYSNYHALINIEATRGFINAYDEETNTYYYGVENLDPEEFIKEGHIFVQMFNKILKTPTTNLVHGAVVGLNNKGILFCARGQRGKSTLAVLSMMEGFEYVSDDYLIVEKEGDKLYTHPMYSIITLSPRMYNELYDKLDGCRFVSNNARKDKYVINISKYHPVFKKKYPIEICMFPEIVSDSEPSIEPCEKGRAITQLIQSTVMQMNDLGDTTTIKKLLDMVKGFEFYKINLCSDIQKNTEFLREFMNNIDKRERKEISESPIYVDITYDLANILDSNKGIIYSMNKFATNIYEYLLQGVSKASILEGIKTLNQDTTIIEKEFEIFCKSLIAKGILETIGDKSRVVSLNKEFAQEDKYKISLIEFTPKERKELVKEEKELLTV